MNIGRIKTYVLIALIISSIFLSAYLWGDESLLPGGTTLFAGIKQNPVVKMLFGIEEEYSIPKENLSKPENAVVTNGTNRYVFYNTDDNFDRIFSDAKGFLADFFSEKSMVLKSETVESSEWYSVLRNDELLDSRTVYIDYSLEYSSSLFAQVIGAKNTWLDRGLTVREFIIAPLDEGGTNLIFYMRDSRSGAVHKYFVKYDKLDIYGNILKAQSEDASGYLFAFELNLDKSEDDAGVGTGVTQKVFFDPLVLISPYPQENAVIKSINPLDETDGYDKIVQEFGYKPASLKWHVDSQRTRHYVDNYSTFKIYPGGFLEYTSLDGEHGIRVAGAGASVYEQLNSAIEFAEGVWGKILPGKKLDVLVTSNLLTPSDDGLLFTLDYYFEGTPVSVNTQLPFEMKRAIEIKMKDGVITGYRHILRRFEKSGENVSFTSPVEVLDGIYSMFKDGEEVSITDLYATYKEDGVSDVISPMWCVKLSNRENPIFYTP